MNRADDLPGASTILTKIGILTSGRGSIMVALVDAAKSGEIPNTKVAVVIRRGPWPELPNFDVMQKLGNVSEKEMFRTFNMGIRMVVICSRADAGVIRENIGNCFEIGSVVAGSKEATVSR